jgi:hypothetical protein
MYFFNLILYNKFTMKKLLLIIVVIASISTSCNRVNLSQDEAKALIVQSLHLPFIFRFDINKRASFDNDFAVYGLYKAGLTTGGDYYPGQTINIQPTELGKPSYLGDNGNAYMFKTNDIVFVQITGIAINKDQQTATIRFTLKADNVTLAGYTLAKTNGDLNGNKCIVYSLTRPLNGELTYKKFDNGWQLATDQNKSSLDLLNQILDTSENSNLQDDYSNQMNNLTAEFQAKQAKANASRQADLITFWNAFKNAVLKKDYGTISQLTYFPFMEQNSYIKSADFKPKEIFDNISASITTTNPTINSGLTYPAWQDANGNQISAPFDANSFAFVNVGGPALVFAQINGKYKFIEISYGE